LIVVDIPNGLLVSNVLVLTSNIPTYNKLNLQEVIESIFEFASKYIHDDGVILLFHPENGKVKEFTLERDDTYGFVY